MRSRICAGLCVAAAFAITVTAQQAPAAKNDPRIGLKAGLKDAGEAAKNLEKIATLGKPCSVQRQFGTCAVEKAEFPGRLNFYRFTDRLWVPQRASAGQHSQPSGSAGVLEDRSADCESSAGAKD